MGRKAAYERKDKFYEKAKAEGFNSRAAYKLMELDKRFGLLKPGSKVIELGAWPGGWTQVAAKRVGKNGLVVAVDLVPMPPLPFPNTRVITGDADDAAFTDQALSIAPEMFDLLLSDMSPKLSGIKSVDQAASVSLCETALQVAGRTVRNGGGCVIKAFKGNDTEEFFRTMRQSFETVKRCELDSTRRSSNEIYLVGLGMKGRE